VTTPGRECEGRAKISFGNKRILFFKPTLRCTAGWSRLPVPFTDKDDTLLNRLYPIFLGRREPLPFFVPLMEKRKKGRVFTTCSAGGRLASVGPSHLQEGSHNFKGGKMDF
jgi:hypothetical protein